MEAIELLEMMRKAVLEGEEEEAVKMAHEGLEKGMSPQEIMDKGFLPGIREAGELYQQEEYFLPDLVCAADAMKAALEVINPVLKKEGKTGDTGKTVMLATVQGDVHDIGKTIVGAMMTANGWNLVDLGQDVKNEEVIRAVEEKSPHVLGLSALLTSTMEEQREVIRLLVEKGLRSQVKVLVGGAPVNQDWADRIGADGYAESAVAAVTLAQELLR
jgi:corrinoid protein of di/trimethylamine methyltransferase